MINKIIFVVFKFFRNTFLFLRNIMSSFVLSCLVLSCLVLSRLVILHFIFIFIFISFIQLNYIYQMPKSEIKFNLVSLIISKLHDELEEYVISSMSRDGWCKRCSI